ncbi:unnamed protein product, partial [Meganyctiphanes norvegica]
MSSLTEAKKSLSESELDNLIIESLAARDRAYCPYSKFSVGAALLTEDGTIIKGCNVENASYGLTICAERNAICQAVAGGRQKFKAIVISGDVGDKFITPCGACRQTLVEFGVDWDVYLAKPNKQYCKTTVASLIPNSFTPNDLIS